MAAVATPVIIDKVNYHTSEVVYTQYERAAFGSGWADEDHDGCNTRIEVLERQSQNEVVDRCKIKSGTLIDPYQGETLNIETDAIEIDHTVALSDAWHSGADRWTQTQRIVFANDEANLVATSRSNNRAKSDRGPDEWQPKIDICDYVLRYAKIKHSYGLTITPAQQARIQEC